MKKSIICILGYLYSFTSLLYADAYFMNGNNAPLTGGSGIDSNQGYVRHWTGRNVGPQWTIDVKKAGSYTLYLNVAQPGTGGTLGIVVDGQQVAEIPTIKTANWTTWAVQKTATFNLTAGKHTIAVLSRKMTDRYLMDLKAAYLTNETKIPPVDEWGMYEIAPLLPLTQPDAFLTKLMSEPAIANNPMARQLFEKRFPVQVVWLKQDSKMSTEDLLKRIAKEPSYLKQLMHVFGDDATGDTWTDYFKSATARRARRLASLKEQGSQIIFAKHHIFGSVQGIYLMNETEGSSQPSMLCSIDLTKDTDGTFAPTETFYDPGAGQVRDPAISFDATKLLFSMRKTKTNYNSTHTNPSNAIVQNKDLWYKIYEMNLADKSMRQLTNFTTYGSDIDPCYLPNGDVVFNSARIVQHVTCGWGDCSNLFLMNKDGKYARRIGFDQTSTAFPSVINDGRVVYTRRDYNDRGQTSAHALFQMNQDGTGQTELYGNQTGLPNSFQHTKSIPGTNILMCIIGGYHTSQGGKLVLMDVSKGRQGSLGIRYFVGGGIPPSGPGYDDWYGKGGEQFSNPEPINIDECIVSIAPRHNAPYALYYLNSAGDRELLSHDPRTSCLQATIVRKRLVPQVRGTILDYTKKDGTFYVSNVYEGMASVGIKSGDVKKLRVIELLYKPTTIGASQGQGPGGLWHTVTPTGHGLAAFESKRIIGDAIVNPDGSALFSAPARKPLYFQLLNDKNECIQTMRSWVVLMPGEHFSCVGCHEDKNSSAYSAPQRTQAYERGVEPLKNFYGEPRAFSFTKEIQPILDKHCISCHATGKPAAKIPLTKEPYFYDREAGKNFTTSYVTLAHARPARDEYDFKDFGFHPSNKVWLARKGKALPTEPNRFISYLTRFERMGPHKPYRTGALRSPMIQLLRKGHAKVKLPQESIDKLSAWIDLNIPFVGEYDEANTWNESNREVYRIRMKERARNEAIDAANIQQMLEDQQ